MKHDELTGNNKVKIPKILIVEDDNMLKPLWSFVTSKVSNKNRIDWVTTELEAEELLKKSIEEKCPYDLVIIDIILDGPRNGFDLYAKYGDVYHDRIIITSGLQYQSYNGYLENGHTLPYCLEKPLVPSECIEAVNKILYH